MVFWGFSGYIPRSGIVRSLIIREMQTKTTMSYHYLEWPSPKSLLLLLLSRFSRVWLCVIPHTAAHQAPPSLGFSRQEHWSVLPFPSPMHESEKWKGSSVVSDPQRPHGLQPSRLLHPWDFPGKSTGVGCHCLLLIKHYKPLLTFLIFKSKNENTKLN